MVNELAQRVQWPAPFSTQYFTIRKRTANLRRVNCYLANLETPLPNSRLRTQASRKSACGGEVVINAPLVASLQLLSGQGCVNRLLSRLVRCDYQANCTRLVLYIFLHTTPPHLSRIIFFRRCESCSSGFYFAVCLCNTLRLRSKGRQTDCCTAAIKRTRRWGVFAFVRRLGFPGNYWFLGFAFAAHIDLQFFTDFSKCTWSNVFN